jgi:hypothetical protein
MSFDYPFHFLTFSLFLFFFLGVLDKKTSRLYHHSLLWSFSICDMFFICKNLCGFFFFNYFCPFMCVFLSLISLKFICFFFIIFIFSFPWIVCFFQMWWKCWLFIKLVLPQSFILENVLGCLILDHLLFHKNWDLEAYVSHFNCEWNLRSRDHNSE